MPGRPGKAEDHRSGARRRRADRREVTDLRVMGLRVTDLRVTNLGVTDVRVTSPGVA